MDFLGVDHVEFYVGDARQAAYLLCSGFGFRLYGQGGPETGLPGQRSLLLGQGDCRVLLTSGLTPDHPAVEYVARHGDGVAVIAFGTRDATAAYTTAVVAARPRSRHPGRTAPWSPPPSPASATWCTGWSNGAARQASSCPACSNCRTSHRCRSRNCC
ncbi:VOC family protein [Kitasatospora gansuensis]